MAFLDNTGLTKLVELIKGSLPVKATSSTLGLVKPDNSTITVDEDGVISSSGGGGSSYTAGDGISIDENNVIEANYQDSSLVMLMSLLGQNDNSFSFSSFTRDRTKEEVIEALKKNGGFVLYTKPSGLNQAAFSDIGITQIKKISNSGTITVSSAWSGENNTIYWRIGSTLFCAPLGTSDYRVARGIVDNIYYNNTSSGLSASTVKSAIDEVANNLDTRIPAAPTTDGNYVLKCVVSSGTPTYSWVSEA